MRPGARIGLMSIYWPLWASREQWQELLARTSAALRGMPPCDAVLAGGDLNAEVGKAPRGRMECLAQASASWAAAASPAWRPR